MKEKQQTQKGEMFAGQSVGSDFRGAGLTGTRRRKNKSKGIAERPCFTALCRARCSPDGERRQPGCVMGLRLPPRRLWGWGTASPEEGAT